MGLFAQNFFLAIPFYFLWNYLVPIYFSELPEVYKKVPFFHILGGFLLVGIFRRILFADGNWPVFFKVSKFNLNPQTRNRRTDDAPNTIKDVN